VCAHTTVETEKGRRRRGTVVVLADGELGAEAGVRDGKEKELEHAGGPHMGLYWTGHKSFLCSLMDLWCWVGVWGLGELILIAVLKAEKVR